MEIWYPQIKEIARPQIPGSFGTRKPCLIYMQIGLDEMIGIREVVRGQQWFLVYEYIRERQEE